MSDYNEMHVPFDWEAEGAIPISRREAEEDIFKRVPTPVFKLVRGPRKSVDALPMLMKENVNVQVANATSEDVSKIMTPCKFRQKSKNIPMFTFCVDGLVHACVLDVESGVPLFKALDALNGFAYFAYSSVNSEIERPRFRVVIPLSEPVEAEVYDYCRERMHKAFGEIADKCSFESKRFFFMPTMLTGPYNEKNELHHAEGASLDFIATVGFTDEDRLKMKASIFRRHQAGSKSVNEDERVQYYLSTDFPLMKGNGDSASSFYTAICVCLANGDEETLDLVIDKAKSENWSDREIKHNVSQAKKFLKL